MAFTPEPEEPDFNQLKSTLSSAGLQQKNNPLYQTILQLINKISQLKVRQNVKIENNRISIRTLETTISNIDKDKTEGPASSTDNALVRFDGVTGKLLQESPVISEDDGRLSNVTDPTGAQDAATKNYIDTLLTALEALDFLTHSDESASLPNSRQLLAGTNVTFDDTVANERTINVSSSGNDHVIMSDGGTPPLAMDDGNGNFLYVPYSE